MPSVSTQVHQSNPARSTCSSSALVSSSESEWHIDFSIPELNNFSQHVKDAVNSGVVTLRARREIVQVLRTYMTAFATRPKPEQYMTICRKLIEKYPALKDHDGATKWVSVLKLLMQ